MERKWYRLDNAAKIFPASMRRGWSNVFRLSLSFTEKVDIPSLERALARVTVRFPSICVALKKGTFWYYLDALSTPPVPREEYCHPLYPMTRREMGKCALRILVHENRLAVEFFHALTDGTGGVFFCKTLAAAYLEERYGIVVPKELGVLDPEGDGNAEETEDAFLRYAGGSAAPRKSAPAFCLKGEREKDEFLHVMCGSVPTEEILSLARRKGVSITSFLAAVLVYSLAAIQREKVPEKKEKAVRVQIPVNLRRLFPSATLRNFVAVVNVGMEKGETDASFDEILQRVHHQMGLFVTPRNMRSIFTANVNSEKGLAIRLVPVFLKDLIMRAVFDRVGESSACLCLSNLGLVTFPEEMAPFITRFDFIIGPQAKAPYNCGVVACGDTLRIHLVRNTKEPELERKFFSYLASFGLHLVLESNER